MQIFRTVNKILNIAMFLKHYELIFFLFMSHFQKHGKLYTMYFLFAWIEIFPQKKTILIYNKWI